jgi:hypothetical protein
MPKQITNDGIYHRGKKDFSTEKQLHGGNYYGSTAQSNSD